MNNLKVRTILPNETFNSREDWMKSLGLKPIYREDGTSIAKDVDIDEHFYFCKLLLGFRTFTKKTWSDFVSHRKHMLENFYKQ